MTAPMKKTREPKPLSEESVLRRMLSMPPDPKIAPPRKKAKKRAK